MYCYQKVYHIIQSGDTIYWLAQRYDTTVQDIMDNNPGINPHNLQIGSRIVICPGRGGMPQVDNQKGFYAQPDYNNYYRYNSSMGYIQPGMDNYSQPVMDSYVQPVMDSYIQPAACSCNQMKVSELHENMRKAWRQHVYWTRMLITSIAEDRDDLSTIKTMLMQNAEAIANVFAPYVSMEAAKEITALLSEHLQIGGDLITALKDNDMDKAEGLNKQWYANADKIAEVLSNLNPKYDKEKLCDMLYEHLDLVKKQTDAHLQKDYPAEFRIFDRMEEDAEKMADYLAEGLMQ